MKGVDPTQVRSFADDSLSLAALGSFMVEQRALVREFPRVLGGLGGLRVPTAVLSGERDRLIAPGSARRLAEGIPGAELRIVAGAGHFLPGAAAPALAEAVAAVSARAAW
jgi:pimeloyl-ACP methyl ester carboxylesterase